MSDKTKKREDYISWDEYFFGVSELSAMRSKDPNTQVGACIVNKKNRIVGMGYNGFPAGCSDEELPWGRKAESSLNTKYPYVVHAEVNAILNSTTPLDDCTIYVIMFPCNECAKMIIQSGIKEVVYIYDPYKDTDSVIAAKRMMDMSGVRHRLYTPKSESITLYFNKK